MEMLLIGLGGCASFDVRTMLKKVAKSNDCWTEVDAEQVDAVPAVFNKINLNFIVSGTNLKEAQVKRAVELSAEILFCFYYVTSSWRQRNAQLKYGSLKPV